MEIIDTHCDALWKLQRAKRGVGYNRPLSFKDSLALETNLTRLKKGNVAVQFFAIFVSSSVPADEMWQHALEQVDLFLTEVIGKHPEMKHIKKLSDIKKLKKGEVGALLTLEGAEAIGNDLMKLRTLYQLGVMSLGLTWNHANLCGDGTLEKRGAGLTAFGENVVACNNEFGVLTDLAHLSEVGMWDVLELATFPFVSHANAYEICAHPRNLKDDILIQLIQKEAPIHLVFYPPFINKGRIDAVITDLIRHIEHICSLGGEKQIGFGSDFDGIDVYVGNLENAAHYPILLEELSKYYTPEQVRGFTSRNFLDYVEKFHST